MAEGLKTERSGAKSAGGYFAYSKMTDAAEHVEKSKEKVILVPVFAEE